MNSTLSKNYIPGRVSVIIPTYNYGHLIEQTLYSVFAQSSNEIEIIVVDDGSTDTTSERIKKFGNRIRYIYQENKGLSSARNTGLSHATGEFIQFLDSDDLLSPDTLEKQIGFLKNNPEIPISVCRNYLFQRTDQNGVPVRNGRWPLYRTSLDVHLCYFNIAPPHAYFFRRDGLLKIGWFDTQLKACEDYDFLIRAASLKIIPHYNPETVVYYRKHHQSMSANLANQFIHDKILHFRLAHILEKHPEFPNGKRIEGMLAFSAGVLITAQRLCRMNIDGSIDLLELALKKLRSIRESTNPRGLRWNNLNALFYLRIMSIVSRPDLCQRQSTVRLWRDIENTAAALCGNQSKLYLTAMLSLCVIRNRHRFCRENREINHYLKILGSRLIVDLLSKIFYR